MVHIVEYIWLDVHYKLRSKAKVLDQVNTLADIPVWNYDGSSTGQTTGTDSEIMLIPVALFDCPFRLSNNFIVFCKTQYPDGQPTSTNNCEFAEKVFANSDEYETWFGLEQEYFIYDEYTNLPLGLNDNSPPQGPYYCGVGKYVQGRNIAEEHLQKCLHAGLKISGINAEVALSQMEFQIGPCVGIDVAHQLWTARYILERIVEQTGRQFAWLIAHTVVLQHLANDRIARDPRHL